MIPSPPALCARSRLGRRLLLCALAALPLGAACSSSSSTSTTPITFGVSIVELDGVSPGDPVPARCDGTLAVSVALSSSPADKPFVLRPPFACGGSGRCGYVHVEAQTSDGEVLASVDSASTEALLALDPARLGDLARIRVQLMRGVDQKPLLNPDKSEVTDELSPELNLPTDCASQGAGGVGGAPMGGAGGAPGPGEGGAGAGGEASAGAPAGGAPGAGGAPELGGQGGQGGASAGAGGA